MGYSGYSMGYSGYSGYAMGYSWYSMGYQYRRARRYTIMHIDEFIDELLNEEVQPGPPGGAVRSAMMHSAL